MAGHVEAQAGGWGRRVWSFLAGLVAAAGLMLGVRGAGPLPLQPEPAPYSDTAPAAQPPPKGDSSTAPASAHTSTTTVDAVRVRVETAGSAMDAATLSSILDEIHAAAKKGVSVSVVFARPDASHHEQEKEVDGLMARLKNLGDSAVLVFVATEVYEVLFGPFKDKLKERNLLRRLADLLLRRPPTDHRKVTLSLGADRTITLTTQSTEKERDAASAEMLAFVENKQPPA